MVGAIRYAGNRWEFIYFKKKKSDYLHVKVGLL